MHIQWHDKTFYGHCKDICIVFESGTDSCSCCRSVAVRTRKTDPMDMACAHGEDQFVIMFGGLHIKMAVLKASHVYVTLYQINLCLSTV